MRCRWWIGLVVLTALSVAGHDRLEAQEPGKDHPAAAAGHGDGAASAGGPEMIFAPALDLTIWSIVVFLILLYILGKYAWGPMMKGLTAREQSIHAAVDEAHKAREETARLRDEVVRERAKAEEEARGMIDQARREAQKVGDELRSKALAEIQTERERLRRDLELARDAALEQLWQRSADLAAQVAGRVIPRRMTPEDHRQLLDDAIVELKRVGDERKRETVGL